MPEDALRCCRLIDRNALDAVSAAVRASLRGRMNANFHRRDDCSALRLLNVIEPGSYVRPDRHLDPTKDELFAWRAGLHPVR